MMFETIITDVNTLGVAIDKVNAVMKTQTSLNVMDYSLFGTALDGLSAKQVALALSTQKLSEVQLEEIVVKNNLISKYGAEELVKVGLISANSSLLSSEKAVDAELVKQDLLNAGLGKSQAKRLISQHLSIAADGEETASKQVLIKTMMDEAIQKKLISAENAQEILSSYGVVTADVAEKASKEALTTATWAQVKAHLALMASNPMTWIMALIGVTYAAVKAYDYFNVTVEEANETLKESKSEYDSVTSNLQSLQDELKTTSERIDELNSKESLSLVEDEELERLKETTRELEYQLALKKEEQRISAEETVDDAKDVYTKRIISDYSKKYVHGNSVGNRVLVTEELEYAIEEYKKQEKALENARERFFELDEKKNSEGLSKGERVSSNHGRSTTTVGNEEQEYEDLKTDIEEIEEAMTSASNRAYEMAIYIENVRSSLQAVQDGGGMLSSDDLNMLRESTAYMDEYEDFYNYQQGILENFDKMNVTEQREALVDKLKKSGLTAKDAQEIIDNTDDNDLEVVAKIRFNKNETQESVEGAIKEAQKINTDESDKLSFETLIESAESASDAVSALRSSISTLNDAFAEQKENGSISVDTMLSLVEAGYATALQFDAATGACTINTQAMYALVKSKIENQIQDLKILKTEIAGKLHEEGVIANASAEGFINLAKAKFADAEATALQQKQSIEDFNSAEAQIIALENALKNYDKVQAGDYSTSFKSPADSAAKAAEDAAQATKDYIEAYMDFQKESLEAGKTDYNTYCNSVSELLNSMYQDGKISAQDYHNYIGQMLDEQLSIYDKALSAVTRRIDKEIDGIEDIIASIEKQNDALENQLDNYDTLLSVVDSVYEAEIDRIKAEQDAIQDTIDALQDENDERELALQLEQAKYNLYKAQNQRTKKVFNGTEFVYETDQDAIREAQENLADLTLEQTISGLETEKDALDSVIEELEYYQSLWAEISTAKETEENRQLAIALWGKDYESIILSNRISDIDAFKNNYISIQDQINDNEGLIASYEEKIEYYEALKEQWSSISDAYEQTQEDQYAAMLLGQNWEAEVLSGRTDTLNQFKDDYISIQQAIVDAAWASANEQIAAAKEAEKAASGSTGSTGSIADSVNSLTDKASSILSNALSTTNAIIASEYAVVDSGTGSIIKTTNAANKANAYIKEGVLLGIYDEGELKVKKYAAGTTNAKRGINLVGEEGTETYIDNDGNIALVTKPTLIPMEGGETVKNAAETKSLLDMDNLVPVDTFELPGIHGEIMRFTAEELQQKVLSVMSGYSGIVQPPMMQTPMYDSVPAGRDNSVKIEIGDIHLHEVQKVDTLAKDIVMELPNKVIQRLGKR